MAGQAETAGQADALGQTDTAGQVDMAGQADMVGQVDTAGRHGRQTQQAYTTGRYGQICAELGHDLFLTEQEGTIHEFLIDFFSV